jgi:hypothetical protein
MLTWHGLPARTFIAGTEPSTNSPALPLSSTPPSMGRPMTSSQGVAWRGTTAIGDCCCASFALHFPGMQRSTAKEIRERVRATPSRSMLRASDFMGSSFAVDSTLSRLAMGPEPPLMRVRRGLYWKPPTTRFGPVPPSPIEVALAVAGTGSGPSGLAAAAALGLTTQVPSVVEIATPGRAPRPMSGVRFRQRGYHRRELKLRPLEVAVLEVLREGPGVIESSPSDMAARIRELELEGKLRLGVLEKAVAQERDARVQSHFAALRSAVDRATPR